MKEKLTDIACCARILGALFYYSPEAPEARAIVNALRMPGWEREWPCGFDSARVAGFYTLNSGDETLAQAWQRLFIGPDALPAPPWGSVWLDRESVLFGDSTLALQGWLRDNAIAFETPLNEPADHIGLLLLLTAWLAEQGKTRELDELLAWHLLPFAPRFLEVFCTQAQHPFYEALGELTRATLTHWRSGLLMPVSQKTLYR
ncbi:Tat proofreading chaperone DmsD [Cronobacter sakazakii]|uniref:Tat proofreading chaperone DmsD n=1 Tax=Cronobacter sakazakii TaxID=28141 RepID=UPI0013B7404D|nr:Tat proofreading chaperone DmsD [Cronobacter sakazakii]KAB1490721.1 Tat proofreading chaperone DmsD [Cronobacter sakazakii]